MKYYPIAFAFLLSTTSLASAATQPPPVGCNSPENRQFDFWVGKWDVFAKRDSSHKVANSLIENLYYGCGIRENWMPNGGHTGGSISAYATEKKEWRQLWTDSDGTNAVFEGNWTGKAMVIAGVWPQPGHPTQITRITYTPLADGSVEQLGVTSDDNGKTWQPSFDFIYRHSK